jgi:hypothetical protein
MFGKNILYILGTVMNTKNPFCQKEPKIVSKI